MQNLLNLQLATKANYKIVVRQCASDLKERSSKKNNRITLLNPVENYPAMDVARSAMVGWVGLLLAQHGGKIALIGDPQTTLQVAESNYLKTNKRTLMQVLKHSLLMSRWRMMSSHVPQIVKLF